MARKCNQVQAAKTFLHHTATNRPGKYLACKRSNLKRRKCVVRKKQAQLVKVVKAGANKVRQTKCSTQGAAKRKNNGSKKLSGSVTETKIPRRRREYCYKCGVLVRRPRGRPPVEKRKPGRPFIYAWCEKCKQKASLKRQRGREKAKDDGTFSVFAGPEPWTITEEEVLLDAVEQFGFGNWDDVASHVRTKSPTDCQQHYYAFYLHGNIGKVTYNHEPWHRVVDHTCPEGGPLSPSLTAHTTHTIDLSPLEQHELGYMPLRDDFEREYDNEAESLVSSLSINYDDDDLDIAFKLAQVDIYRQRLKERQRRKTLSRDFGIIQSSTSVGVKRLQASKKKQSKDERDFQDRMRVFAQFHTTAEHQQFFESLQKEKKVKHRIKELMKYRRNGITQFDDCADYDAERQNRDKKKDRKGNLASAARRTSMASKKENEEDVNIIIGDIKRNGLRRELSSMPGCDLLSERERKLCNTIGMKPASYITVKTCIIKDYLQRRHGFPIKIRYPSHLDKTHRRRILNFLSENGWIGGVGAF